MGVLQPMPQITFDPAELKPYGDQWVANGERLLRSPPHSSLQFGNLFDGKVGAALAVMLGDVPVLVPNARHLQPENADCVEVGPVRVVGGVRPQNFDVGYRPDGVRFMFDSKTLNDTSSIGKNYQNMINDLATEATTVHSRFPYAVVGFMVVTPGPALAEPQSSALMGTLERLSGRFGTDEPNHLAEAICHVVWDPYTGEVDALRPSPESPLRVEVFSEKIERAYLSRYKGLPPHAPDAPDAPDAPADD